MLRTKLKYSVKDKDQIHSLPKVLKPELDYTVRSRKPQTGHFYGLLNMKNHSMKKSNELYGPWSDCSVLWTMTGLGSSHGSFVSSLKQHHFGLYSLFYFPYGVQWIILSNKKPSPHSFNQETLSKYRPKFKIQLAWSLDYKTKISNKKQKRRKKWSKQMYLTKKK